MAPTDKLDIKDFNHIKNESIQADGQSLSDETEIKLMSIEDFTRKVVENYQYQYSEQQLASLLGIGRKALWVRRNRWGLFRKKIVN